MDVRFSTRIWTWDVGTHPINQSMAVRLVTLPQAEALSRRSSSWVWDFLAASGTLLELLPVLGLGAAKGEKMHRSGSTARAPENGQTRDASTVHLRGSERADKRRTCCARWLLSGGAARVLLVLGVPTARPRT
ncbi:hypothetical protein AGIG_G22491 [Arapaima gigas]